MKKIGWLIGILFINNVYAADFTLTSDAFKDKKAIPPKYTCNGKDISPAFKWTNAPWNTKSFVMISTDPDAPSGTWYHWIVYNMPPETKELLENHIPLESTLGKNSWGSARYNGPCPPIGKKHNYVFTLYALDKSLDATKTYDAKEIEKAMKDHVLKSAKITGTFSRKFD